MHSSKSREANRSHGTNVDWPIADHSKAVCCTFNHVHVGHFDEKGKMISELILPSADAWALAQQLLRAYDKAEDIL
jgi:hypothetical protein